MTIVLILVEPSGRFIGIDTLTITPIDESGNQYAIVLVNLFTKHCKIYPAADKSAETLAQCIFSYFVTYGKIEEIHSDPGSDLTSDTTAQLEAWFGVKHVFSLSRQAVPWSRIIWKGAVPVCPDVFNRFKTLTSPSNLYW